MDRTSLTETGHSAAGFIEEQEGNHEEGVGRTQHRLECHKLREGDQPGGGERDTALTSGGATHG